MSALYIPKASEERMLDLILAVGYTLRLFRTDVTTGKTAAQINALVAADFTEANFAGYSSAALTGGSWVTTPDDPASSGVYAQQTFTRSSTGATQSVYGYYLTRTSDGVLVWFEQWVAPVSVTNINDAIKITPTFMFSEDSGAQVSARGKIASQSLTSDSVGYTTSTTTDFSLAGVVVDSTRLYRVHLHTLWGVTGPPGRWLVTCHVAGSAAQRMGDIIAFTESTPDSDAGVLSTSWLWTPSTSTVALDIRLTEVTGTSTLTFLGNAAYPRQFWVEDVGAV